MTNEGGRRTRLLKNSQGCRYVYEAMQIDAEILHFWSPSYACHPIIIQEASQLFRFLSKVDKA